MGNAAFTASQEEGVSTVPVEAVITWLAPLMTVDMAEQQIPLPPSIPVRSVGWHIESTCSDVRPEHSTSDGK